MRDRGICWIGIYIVPEEDLSIVTIYDAENGQRRTDDFEGRQGDGIWVGRGNDPELQLIVRNG